MIDCLIFTKDRACQLDLLLRSIRDNFQELTNVNILYCGSNDEFLEGYNMLIEKYPEHRWIVENNLTEDIKAVVSTFKNEFSMTLVDDEVVIRDHSIGPLLEILRTNDNVHCASLRMGRNVDYTYTANLNSPPPKFITREGMGDVYGWIWAESDPNTDWGYPSCINSHIYRTCDLKKWILENPFSNVNDLEGMLNRQRELYGQIMICNDRPKTLNIANNLVQSGNNRHSNKKEYTPAALNNKFLSGWSLDSDYLYNFETNCATLELDYKWQTTESKYQTL